MKKFIKRILAFALSVVIFATAIIVLPKTQIVANAENSGVNVTWDNSVHAMEDGDYVSKDMYSLTADQDEYTLPNTWHVSTFNDCETTKDAAHNYQVLFDETGNTIENAITIGQEATPSQLKNLPGNDGYDYGTSNQRKLLPDYADHKYSYYAALSKEYKDAREPKNIRVATYNYNSFDIGEYKYLRFQLYRENLEIVESAMDLPEDQRPYAKVMIYDDSGSDKPRVGYEFTSIFLDDNCRAYNYLIDISDLDFVVTNVEFHFRTIRRESTDKSTEARIWFDNVRFLKNATHSKYYAYNVNGKDFEFHGCENTNNTQSNIPLSGMNYDINWYNFAVTNEPTSVADGSGSLCLQPKKYDDNTDTWYQVAFQNSTGVRLIDYQYFRFYFFVGEKIIADNNNGESWPNSNDFRIYFNEYYDYASTNDSHPESIGFVVNPQLTQLKGSVKAAGWYICTVPIDKIQPYQQGAASFDLNKTIKSISIQIGSLRLKTPTDFGGEKYAFHFDKLEFLGYSYTPNTDYTYQAGHYEMLENFEQTADAKLNTNSFTDAGSVLAMHRPDVYTNSTIESSSGTWMYKYNDSGKISDHYKSYYCADFDHMVTQGMYADWLRCASGDYKNSHSGNMEAAYNFRSEDNSTLKTRDLSKFTHFSLDFTIRSQDRTLGQLTGPGLQGTKETFRIRIRSKNDGGEYLESRLTFVLNLSSDTTGTGANPFYTSNDGIQILPMEGFVPGRAGLYTCSGTMRITFTLADILAHAGDGFDITQADQIRFEWFKSDYKNNPSRDAQEYDHRMADMFLDNFVGFTPDMTLTVRVEDVPESDMNQPFVFNVKGRDDVSEHVDFKFALVGVDGEREEVIYNLPFNSYEIIQTNWSWRFQTQTKQIAQQMATLDKPSGGRFTYKDMVENKVALSYTVVFKPQKINTKWLTDERRNHFKAKN